MNLAGLRFMSMKRYRVNVKINQCVVATMSVKQVQRR